MGSVNVIALLGFWCGLLGNWVSVVVWSRIVWSVRVGVVCYDGCGLFRWVWSAEVGVVCLGGCGLFGECGLLKVCGLLEWVWTAWVGVVCAWVNVVVWSQIVWSSFSDGCGLLRECGLLWLRVVFLEV